MNNFDGGFTTVPGRFYEFFHCTAVMRIRATQDKSSTQSRFRVFQFIRQIEYLAGGVVRVR